MITDEQIADAKARTIKREGALHEHPDCIRLAYEWLDAQDTIKAGKTSRALKHIIEKWAGRYISQSDVEVAATLHPKIEGTYPEFNLSARMTLPHDRRLDGIGEALSQGQRERLDRRLYKIVED